MGYVQGIDSLSLFLHNSECLREQPYTLIQNLGEFLSYDQPVSHYTQIYARLSGYVTLPCNIRLDSTFRIFFSLPADACGISTNLASWRYSSR